MSITLYARCWTGEEVVVEAAESDTWEEVAKRVEEDLDVARGDVEVIFEGVRVIETEEVAQSGAIEGDHIEAVPGRRWEARRRLSEAEFTCSRLGMNRVVTSHGDDEDKVITLLGYMLELQPELINDKEDEIPPLAAAAGEGLVKVVRYLVESGMCLDNQRRNAVREACHRGRLETVKYLLERGARGDLVGDRFRTCLSEHTILLRASYTSAIRAATRNNHPDIVAVLLSHGVTPNSEDGTASNKYATQNHNGCSILWDACSNGHYEVYSLLITHGANPHKLNNSSQSPLWAAARSGSLRIVRDLVEMHNTDIEKGDSTRLLPMGVAKLHGNVEVAAYLKSKMKEKEGKERSVPLVARLLSYLPSF